MPPAVSNVAGFRWIDPEKIKVPETSSATLMSSMEVVSAFKTSDDDYKEDISAAEGKILVGVCLSMKHHSAAGQSSTYVNNYASQRPSVGSAKSPRGPGYSGQRYERYFHFADAASSDGGVFAVLCKNSVESRSFFRHAERSGDGVGCLFAIEEPEPTVDFLGTDNPSLPIITGFTRAIPLAPDFEGIVPKTTMIAPPMGHTRYFAGHGAKNIGMATIVLVNASCNGTMCDRQSGVLSAGVKCGCTHTTSNHAKLVVSMRLSLPCDTSFDPSRRATVYDFRSIRTSRLFIDSKIWNSLDIDNPNHKDMIRQAVKNVSKYVNDRGGWTYVGWLRTGKQLDASAANARDAEDVTSINQRPHVSYLYPTKADDIVGTAEFRRLMLNGSHLNAEKYDVQCPAAPAN